MSYDAFRTAIAAILNAITDIGVVHNRPRYSNNWQAFLELFQYDMSDGSGQLIRGWTMTRRGADPQLEGMRFGTVSRYHHFTIQGFMSFSDANDSEGAFQALVDSVLTQLDANFTVSTSIAESVGPAVLRLLELRQFGGVVCHYAEIDLTIPEDGI